MPKFVIEREMPGIGKISEQEMQQGARNSNEAVRNLGGKIQWVQSYVTNDKIYCVYIADNVELIKEHASKSKFPAHRIEVIKTIIDPTTAE
jgi:hypothetical protein